MMLLCLRCLLRFPTIQLPLADSYCLLKTFVHYFLCALTTSFLSPLPISLTTLSGTPEYLSPSTVRNKECGVEVDLWALGVVFFQMLLGYTPFGAPSPYLTFLKIKRARLLVSCGLLFVSKLVCKLGRLFVVSSVHRRCREDVWVRV